VSNDAHISGSCAETNVSSPVLVRRAWDLPPVGFGLPGEPVVDILEVGRVDAGLDSESSGVVAVSRILCLTKRIWGIFDGLDGIVSIGFGGPLIVDVPQMVFAETTGLQRVDGFAPAGGERALPFRRNGRHAEPLPS
jgi:hypothetical protein